MKSPPFFKTVYFDIVGSCNARCPYCLTGIKESRSGGEITPARFAQALGKLISVGAINDRTVISLYNWGEPFLHRDLQGIIRVINDAGVRYALSTNASRITDINEAFVRNLDHLIFSMCGFSQTSYDRIQRLKFERVKENIIRIVRDCRIHGFRGDFRIFFHVYRFNESEIDPCKRFANLHGILFHPHYAILNRWDDLRMLAEGRMPPAMHSAISEDLQGLDVIPGIMARADGKGYICPQYDYLIVTENADVVACCQLPKDRPEFLCGNVIDDDLTEILQRRQEMAVCRDCIRSGLASLINNSIKTPASYRKGLQQSLLFIVQKIRRLSAGRI